jgi:predicted nucleic acid-binding protein
VTTLYVETSAVLAWLLDEPTAAEVRESVDSAETVVTSELTWVEVERVVARGESSGALRGGDAQKLRGSVARQRAAWMSMTVSAAVLARTGRVFPLEPVRTLDALHLATALEFTKAFQDLRILTFDRRIAENATALGIG